MTQKILVAYATKNGSTHEIAGKIAGTLRDSGLAVDLQLVRDVRRLDGYAAVVLGAPLYMFHWHKDAHQFLARHQTAFEGGLPVAIFAGGPIGDADEKAWQEIRRRFDQELAQYAWLKPVALEIVGGKFDPSHIPFPYNLIPAMRQMPASDLRDWKAIEAFALNLASKFQPVMA